ncbi:TadE/TadG family type IV pilus assembly protein [Methyloraptor flagellatus]|uniref:Pilus assembly protein TadG-related protein n=1 Tax=Methyloraptor flagellatus TaxID=3162530 RepID=A0AAU7XBN0_9HYPH
MLGFDTFKKLWGNRRGNVVVVFALTVPIVASATGGFVDFNRMGSLRRQVQDAMDLSVLSAFKTTTVPNNAVALQVFSSRTFDPALKVDIPTFTNPNASSIKGSVTAKYKPAFLSMAGITSLDIAVSSTALAEQSQGIATLTASTVSAKGAFDKQIYFFTKDADGKVISQSLLLDYDYTLNGYNYTSTKVYTPPIGNSKTITIQPYQTYGYYMIAYQDTTYYGKRINPVTSWSDDPNAAKFRKSTGDCSTSSGQTDNWEDGGDNDFADFSLTLKCTKGPTGPLVVRLSR